MADAGMEDAAILLMSLGEIEAAEVFKHLAPKEVQKLGETIARLKVVPRERLTRVLDKFSTESLEQHTLVANTDEYVKSVLRKALGDDKANLLIDRILQGSDVTGIEGLKWMDPGTVAELMRNEHPQIVAAILVHLDSDQAAEVMKCFTERQRNEVMVRIATLDGIQPAALKDLNEVMSSVLAGGEKMRKASLGGVKTASEIINQLGSALETSVLDYVRESDADLAQMLMDNMFGFDDLIKVDDKGIQAVLKEVQSESLVLALKGATPEVRDKVFRNMSSRAAETLREDLDGRGPVRVSDVEAEQKEILKVVRRLVDDGQIVIAGGGADEFLCPRAAPGASAAQLARRPGLHPVHPARGVAGLCGLAARRVQPGRRVWHRPSPAAGQRRLQGHAAAGLSAALAPGRSRNDIGRAANQDARRDGSPTCRGPSPGLPRRLPRRSGGARELQAATRQPAQRSGRSAVGCDGPGTRHTRTTDRRQRCAGGHRTGATGGSQRIEPATRAGDPGRA